MKNNPLNFLHQIGLSKSEALLYVTGLELPSASVSTLMIQTKLKRPTVYRGLNALVQKSLATEVKEGKELRYTMRPPEDLEGFIQTRVAGLQHQASQVENLIPLFPRPVAIGGNTSDVQHVTGVEGVQSLIDRALFCTSHRWCIVAPRRNFIAESDAAYIQYFKKIRKNQQIQSRTLWEGKWEGSSVSLADVVNRKPRFLPHTYDGRFQSMMILFDGKVLFISSYAQAEAVLIDSPEVHALQEVLFDALWSQSTKV